MNSSVYGARALELSVPWTTMFRDQHPQRRITIGIPSVFPDVHTP